MPLLSKPAQSQQSCLWQLISTSLWYMPAAATSVSDEYKLKDWGWTAFWKHKMALQDSGRPASFVDHAHELKTNYLRCIGKFIKKQLEGRYEGIISKKDVEWCLTVPALWDDADKQQMVDCAQMAGLVGRKLCKHALASHHSVIIVLEPEADSVYCQGKLKDIKFTEGSSFL
ncbi:hypothetical protein R1flu_004964 [Riccia fluitans]|uniref:Uncharacterized protein n=1 Tax=Riccia fluitans TaxID=41844 RepID=A0ABD1YRT6_9MARC